MTDPASKPTASLVNHLLSLSRVSEICPVILGDYDRAVISEIAMRLMSPGQIVQADASVICDTTREADKPARIMTRPDTAGMP